MPDNEGTVLLTSQQSDQTTAAAQPPATQSTASSDWRSQLPDDLKADPSLENISDIATLAKNYVYTKKHVGSDKIPLPGKHATEGDWKEFYKKIGMPESPDKYEIKVDEGVQVNEDFFKAFKDIAFQNNILPSQAEKLIGWYNKTNQELAEKYQTANKQAQVDGINGLRKEWGNAFQSKLSKAQMALKEFGDPQIVKYLEETGLGNDARIIKLLSNIGESFGEDKVRDHIQSSMQVMSPDQAKNDINKILSDFNHPYHQSSHPNHGAAVKEMEDLFSHAYPSGT